MKVLVLLNERSGTLAASQTCDEPARIREGFAAHGVEADVRCVPPAELAQAAAAARDGTPGGGGYDAVIAGGGDGTLNTVANALAGGPVAFGVLPLGTHNHFAKELGTPLDLGAAVAALADALRAGAVEELDVAAVNGRVFLNFSGIGLHPQVVRERDEAHRELRRSAFLKRLMKRFLKVFALMLGLLSSLRRLPLMRVVLTGGHPPRSIRRVTPSVVVCNNPYQMKVFGVEDVSHPDRGMLNVYVARAKGAVGIVRMVLASMVRRLGRHPQFESIPLPGVEVMPGRRRRRIPVSIDGEVVELETPLRYEVRPGGLRVVKPTNKDEGGRMKDEPAQ